MFSAEFKLPPGGLFGGARAGAVIDDQIEAAMHESLTLLEGRVIPATPSNFGHLRAGWASQIVATPIDITGRVFNNVPYLGPVEMGTAPHPVSREGRDSLALWAKRKLGVGDVEAKSIAFLIARKIAQRGSKGAFMLTRTWETSKSDVVAIFDAAMRRIAEELRK